jgi:hypothetical protein
MKRFLVLLALCLIAAPVSAQTIFVRVDIVGAARANVSQGGTSTFRYQEGGYGALSASVKSDKFSATVTPAAFIWANADPVYFGNIEGAIAIPKTDIYLGLGRTIFKTYNQTYAVATWWGPNGLPFSVRAAWGQNYESIAFGFYIKTKI